MSIICLSNVTYMQVQSTSISSLKTTCIIRSLQPPPPQAPVNIVIESNTIRTATPTSFVVAVDFRLQQLNEMSALLKDLTHEFVIVETPDGIRSTMADGSSMITTARTTLTNVSVCY